MAEYFDDFEDMEDDSEYGGQLYMLEPEYTGDFGFQLLLQTCPLPRSEQTPRWKVEQPSDVVCGTKCGLVGCKKPEQPGIHLLPL